MRKAFDANVPKLRPRLKAPVATGEVQELPEQEPVQEAVHEPEAMETGEGEALGGDEAADESSTATPSPTATPTWTSTAEAAPLPAPRGEGARSPAATATATATSTPTAPVERDMFTESPDVRSRRERLLAVKRKVAAAARPLPPMPALPETPARAGESALLLVRDLETQLTRAREVELALRGDLDDARGELARGAAESRRGAERLATVEQQVEEKRAVLEEMLAEMGGLEQERDGAVARAQALSALDEERQALLDAVQARAEKAELGRAEAEAEVNRLGTELDDRAADGARLRAALAQVTRERDDVSRELAETRRERDELTDARKALEQVHEALASARARLG